MASRTARLSKKGCGFATPECRAQRDLPVHAGPAAPALLPAAPHRPATTLGYMEISWVTRVGCGPRLASARLMGHPERLGVGGIGQKGSASCWKPRSARPGIARLPAAQVLRPRRFAPAWLDEAMRRIRSGL